MNIVSFCNKVITFAFYTLFLLVPLTFSGSTSELFEFNKMWLTFGMTIIIGATWFIKMTAEKKFAIQRTPFDVPLLLFLVSQILATLISLDQHISWWGYYSRFNGGLLSTICYLFLFYAFVSNLNREQTIKSIVLSVISGIGVVLWGFPSRFGADPTCFVFRGTFDTSCWTDAFKPTVRTFSTLGQPAWFAAYLATLLPFTMALFLKPTTVKDETKQPKIPQKVVLIGGFFLAALFYSSLIFANTRAGFIAFFVADVIFWLLIFVTYFAKWKQLLTYFATFHVIVALCSFFFGMPIASLNKYTFGELTKPAPTQTTAQTQAPAQNAPLDSISGQNITDSGQIRLLVWDGAIKAWQNSPLLGTGVETFAFAYYKFKSPAHNLTSEWDYLYNKAHNEYLNYLATTGILGLGSYLLIIGYFFFQSSMWLFRHHKAKNPPYDINHLLIISIISGYIAIIVSNFFGFSVVIINLFFFLFPAWILLLGNKLNPERQFAFILGEPAVSTKRKDTTNAYQWTGFAVIMLAAGFLLVGLFKYWYADVSYAMGSNYNKAGSPQDAYQPLLQAYQTEPNEPVYADEFATNLATIGTALFMQKDATNGDKFAKQAIAMSDQLLTRHPNNVVFWKNRVRIFYTLAQGDPKNQQVYLTQALQAIAKANELAPNDAKILYNYAVLLGQTGNPKEGIQLLKKTIEMRPNYYEAYVALGLFYRDLAVDKGQRVINPEMNQKAIETYEYILQKVNPKDQETQKTLQKWKQNL